MHPTLGGGRVTGPPPGSSPFSFDDVHQIEALELPGRVVPLFRATGEKSLDLDTYKILTSHKLQQIGGRSPPSYLPGVKSNFISIRKELLEVQGTGAPYPGRVGSQSPSPSRSSPFSFDDVHQIEALSKLPGRVVPLFRAAGKPRSRYL